MAFFTEPVRGLFLRFNDEMNRAFDVYNKWHRYEKVWAGCMGIVAITVESCCPRRLGTIAFSCGV